MFGSRLLRLNIHAFIFLKQLTESMRRHTKTSLQRYKLRHYNKNLSFPSDKDSDSQNQPLILFLQTTKTTILMGFLAVTHWPTWLHQEFQYCDKMSAIIRQAKPSIRSQDLPGEWRKTGFQPKHCHTPLSPTLLLVSSPSAWRLQRSQCIPQH